MFVGQAVSDVHNCGERCKYVRYSSDPSSCKASQTKKCSSGNTHGDVSISVEDNKHMQGGRCRNSTSSVPTSPLSLPLLEDSLKQIEPAPFDHDGATHDNDNIARAQFADALTNPGSRLLHMDDEKVPQTAMAPIGSMRSTGSSSSA
jgi:hypothetical protein